MITENACELRALARLAQPGQPCVFKNGAHDTDKSCTIQQAGPSKPRALSNPPRPSQPRYDRHPRGGPQLARLPNFPQREVQRGRGAELGQQAGLVIELRAVVILPLELLQGLARPRLPRLSEHTRLT
jgi:hypothetical protein